jgi:uncharacterized protein with HEPN domain
VGEASISCQSWIRRWLNAFRTIKKIISFRNILIHGYADVDDELVWDIVETRLPVLRNEIAQIIVEQ